MDIKSIILSGIMGGLGAWWMSYSLGWVHRRYNKDIPKDIEKYSYQINQIRVVKIRGDYQAVFPVCVDAVKTLKKSKINYEDVQSGVIKATIGVSFRSFGEIIEISFRRRTLNKIEIEVTSNPRMWGTTADSGKNFGNIESICEYLKKTW